VVLVILMLKLSDSTAILLPTAIENDLQCVLVSDTSTIYTQAATSNGNKIGYLQWQVPTVLYLMFNETLSLFLRTQFAH
jgi:hypothetical protein